MVVNATLGTHLRTAVATPYLTAKICTYPGGLGLTKITFQQDTAKTYAVSEKAAATRLGAKLVVKKLTVSSHPAWTTNLGDLYVFDGNQTTKILAPGTATAKLEALAKKLF